ncbi:MAG: superoxide dismutase [Acetobacteraceae bacterium]|nr:superoxide dismutase [Acetobacteraceae bacterium]
MTYEAPPLPYAHEALEPVIDAETMRLHHDKHHQAYVDAVNKAIADQPGLQGKTIEDLLRGLDQVPETIRSTVRNNGGGHANHQLFWKIMAPPGQGGGGEPQGALAEQVVRDFGSFEGMRQAFEAAGARHFGSGWVFLVMDPRAKRLEILTLPNQDSVLLIGKPALLANDLWEHAYYLKHRNRRPEYLKAWWGVVNWRYVGERPQGIREGKKQL